MSWFSRQLAKEFRWTDYTPTLSATNGTWNPTVDYCEYLRVGQELFFRLQTQQGAVGTNSGALETSIPFEAYNYTSTFKPLAGTTFIWGMGAITPEIGICVIANDRLGLEMFRPDTATFTTSNSPAILLNLHFRLEDG